MTQGTYLGIKTHWTKGIIVFLFLGIICGTSCKRHPKAAGEGNVTKTPSSFFSDFTALHLPYFVSDSTMGAHIGTDHIDKDALSQVIPDSIVRKITHGSSSAKLNPIGRIDVSQNRYLILSSARGNDVEWHVLAFTPQNKFLSHMELLDNQHEKGYRYKLTINQEPTFLIGREKKDESGHHLYTNKGFGFSQSAKRFTLFINDTNEDLKEQNEIYNPIDTLPAKFEYSGDYSEDKKNFLSLRDGKRPSEYNFFLHFDKSDDDPNAKGELKGTIKMVSPNAGLYQQGGDPCVINFDMTSHSVKIKEQGNCANHRGSVYQFKDTYDRIHKKDKKK